MAKKVKTITTTIRLESDLRSVLEAIASREARSLSGQMILFLRQASKQYLSENGYKYFPDIDEIGTEEEYAEYRADISC